MTAQSNRSDRLYDLLPAVHRMRDVESGEPLRALLQVIAGQLNLVEDDIARLYENWFIETCDDWVVPYIADLVGWQPVHAAGQPESASPAQARALNAILVPRREVANTIRNRRRKGTLALLEELAHDVAGWPARAVEFVHLLAATPGLNHDPRAQAGCVDVRSSDALDRLGGAFDSTLHRPDVHRINSASGRGHYNVPSVGVFAWRLRARSISHAPACCLEEVGPEWYTFSALGNDTQLFVRPVFETGPSAIAEERHVPGPIRRRALLANPDLPSAGVGPTYYGVVPGTHTGQSFAIWAEDWPHKGVDNQAPIPGSGLIAADLRGFGYTAPRDHIAIDPVLGRIAFPPKQLPRKGVWVSYHYGFSADIGGGEYTRPLLAADHAERIVVTGQEQLRHALAPGTATKMKTVKTWCRVTSRAMR